LWNRNLLKAWNEEAVLDLKKYISLLHEDENPQELAWAKNILFKAQLLQN